MTQIKWHEFRENLADVSFRVRHAGERILVTRHGKPWMVVVSPMPQDFKKPEAGCTSLASEKTQR